MELVHQHSSVPFAHSFTTRGVLLHSFKNKTFMLKMAIFPANSYFFEQSNSESRQN